MTRPSMHKCYSCNSPAFFSNKKCDIRRTQQKTKKSLSANKLSVMSPKKSTGEKQGRSVYYKLCEDWTKRRYETWRSRANGGKHEQHRRERQERGSPFLGYCHLCVVGAACSPAREMPKPAPEERKQAMNRRS